MGDKKGFSLVEIIVVMIIVGITAVILIPNLISSTEQSKAQISVENLLAIAAAQSKFNEDYSTTCLNAAITPCYCVKGGTNPVPGGSAKCGDTLADLNANLRLSISDQFTYNCEGLGASYKCTATDTRDTLTLNPTANPMVSCTPLGNGCPSN